MGDAIPEKSYWEFQRPDDKFFRTSVSTILGTRE